MSLAAEPTLVELDALGPNGPFRARTHQTVLDVTGSPVAQLSLVPGLFIHRAVQALRRADALPLHDRTAALGRAGELFRTAEIGGLTSERYQELVSRTSGLGLNVVRQATDRIAEACTAATHQSLAALPTGAALDWDDPRVTAGAGLWVRRGEVFGVLAAGNHPAVHTHWLEALALGYRVAVRPSRSEPFTPARLVAALRLAGFGDDRVAFLPTDHAGADDLVAAVDRAMVYGGDAVIRKYHGQLTVLPQGPGRSKMLITAGTDWRSHLDLIVESVSRHGGVSCTSTTAVFVENDAEELAQELAQRLSAIRAYHPLDERALLPVHPLEVARQLERHLTDLAQGTRALLGGDGVVEDLGDGSAALRPAVHLLDSPEAPQAGVELPFPCVWVAPWTPQAGVAPFADTLAMTAMTEDPALVAELLRQPGIRNLYVGAHPTTFTAPRVPHDGYLADFLMQSKGVIAP